MGGYESPIKKDVESDGTGREVVGESQGSTGPVRRKFRKFGLKKMERNMKEGKKVTLMTNMPTIIIEDKGDESEEYDDKEAGDGDGADNGVGDGDGVGVGDGDGDGEEEEEEKAEKKKENENEKE